MPDGKRRDCMHFFRLCLAKVRKFDSPQNPMIFAAVEFIRRFMI
ncbi:hypothetical protein TPE_0710 [Treponema pedis str. T A4]|uniref:Uncharacterized protein n=1 Tax=Treponema pedis str. T A4 TaxID=1291379 RepID=S6A337_9SPIR|nr:hypothetical protein TPE_0710 [Treponema pedis str. T A4]